jgi:Fe-S-cluster containining protein
MDDLATLCRACGLCCDGSLFGRVGLDAEEVEPARKTHLRVLDSGKAFEQPCPALLAVDGDGERRACSIYADRPRSCRRFVCRLHDRHRREGGPLEPRLAAVRRARRLVAELEASGMTAGDFAGEGERAVTEALEDFARA